MKDKFLPHYQRIGKNVRYTRIRIGWTQEELAHKCSVNREQISRIENARRDYMYSTLLEVCDALDKTIYEISQEDADAEAFDLEYKIKKKNQ